MNKKELILKLYEINAFKFGEFTLVSGLVSPIYLDLKMSISYPEVLQAIATEIWQQISHQKFDLLCGVPYTALPIATVISVEQNIPMVIRRKEMKDHGIIKPIDGKYEEGQNVLVVEDLVTSGTSVLATVDPLIALGLKVTDVAVLIDREQGGPANLAKRGIRLHAVMTLTEVLNVLEEEKKLEVSSAEKIRAFVKNNQVAV